jgi:translation elongation factor EF-1beta
MGKVATLFNVYANQGKEEEVVNEIRDSMKPNSLSVEDIAFGIKIIKVMFIHEDSEGSDVLENRLRQVKETNNVEVAEESLIS